MKKTLLIISFFFCYLNFYAQQWEAVGPNDDLNSQGIAKTNLYNNAIVIGSDMTPYIAYADHDNGGKATVKKFNNGAWENVGLPGISLYNVSNLTLDIDANNIPYIFYSDYSMGGRATVQRFVNGSWEIVGTPGFSTGRVQSPTIKIHPNGTPYIVYDNYIGGNNFTISRFVNNTWEPVGITASIRSLSSTDLAFSSTGIPYLAYMNQNTGGREAVQRFVNNQWEPVGYSSQASGYAYEINIELTVNDVPYISYRDGGTSLPSVQKFNGQFWEFVGQNGFGSSGTIYSSLALTNDGTPYVAYKNGSIGGKLSIQRFKNNAWEPVAQLGISQYSIEWPTLKIANDGTLYTSYYSRTSNDYNNYNYYGFVKKYSENALPIFTNVSSIEIQENTTAITDVNTTDADGDTEGSGITYSLTNNNNGGIDNSLVAIDENTGVLAFENAPNFEIPTDNNTNNIYEIQVTATDSKGGTSSQNLEISISNINDLQLVINSVTNVQCRGENNGEINLTIAEGYPNYTIAWSMNGNSINSYNSYSANYNIISLYAGTISITVTDSNNHSTTEMVTITEPATAISIEATATLVSTASSYDGTIEVEITGGTAPYTYLWSNGNTTKDISGLGEGTYTIFVTDANNCQFNLPVTVIQNNPPEFTSVENVEISENQLSVLNLEIVDTEGETENNGIAYQLTTENGNGTDNNLFQLNTVSGELNFVNAPDFEDPTDENQDNIYDVQVVVTDSYGATNYLNLVVTVVNLENDFDEDGIEDSVDADDDNDGTPDSEDDFPLDSTENTDTDDDGQGNNADTDDDNDGTPDSEDAFPLDATEKTDADGDGTGDNTDTDDDNDGTPDSEDAFPFDSTEDKDTDGDGQGNNADTDDDNDGTPDSEDAFPLDATENTDTDGDGQGDNTDTDDDNDGIPDSEDEFPLVGIDTDADGIPDNSDTDDDNDGTLDLEDAFPTDPTENKDTDGDGQGNNADTDDDNDGSPDSEDAFPLDATENTDTDGDGQGDNTDTDDDNDGIQDSEDEFPLVGIDTDADGIPDNLDTDDDNDGTPDTEDAFPTDTTETLDSDSDGIGNNADPDDDNNGIPDDQEELPTNELDTDNDGIPDALDTDNDNDGTPDSEDAFPFNSLETSDFDGDGIGDNADDDDDNDGIQDSEDDFPFNNEPKIIAAEAFTPNGDGINDNWVIPGLNNYPNNTVKVYNKTGRLVFEAKGYQNNWGGFYKDNREQLPSGSYLYSITLGNGKSPLQGWIFINY
ncbi:T9SS type B sorting domain-containing protein [Maribacter hydrothermalis]|uniref:Cadherin domain-containing protein n=1 Tax=Maribacter hydrothermalis TaxID=1836467 RepID=A0A1B7Z0J2_9FLAO|nr:gliding motility-associated C-terminal domain-containing protein [Maribacter hydrothermalis]APQ16252.1 hypothetical protein BTR34_02330 [Maribacter hydrothermalis]OBR36060.1 hypothetical protein A9200_10205 [Maribacter hydrothermalis]